MTPQEYEAEIARLTQGYEDLIKSMQIHSTISHLDEFDRGWASMALLVIEEIKKITGNEK